jgi:hypothetical protein
MIDGVVTAARAMSPERVAQSVVAHAPDPDLSGYLEATDIASGTITAKTGTINFNTGAGVTADALSFGATTEAVSMSSVAGTATFTYGSASKLAHRTALGLGTGDSPTLTALTVGVGAAATPSVQVGTAATGLHATSTSRLNMTSNGSRCALGAGADFYVTSLRFSSSALANVNYSIGFINNAGVLEIKDSTPAFADLSLRNLTASGTVTEGVYTVATTPTHVLGASIRVNNATGATIGGVVAGTGTQHVVARSNGTQWIVTAIIIP